MAVVEVEIRGQLTGEARAKLLEFLKKEGEYVESHTREMIMLLDVEGYSEDPTIRAVDVRLRNTDGKCEIMVKRKVSDNNVGRSEVSLQLADTTLDNAKEIVKALGSMHGLWMHRKKDIYTYHDIEWSVVEAPKEIYYYEAEHALEEGEDIEKHRLELVAEAEALGLSIFTPEEYHEFTNMLGREVNKKITW